MWSAILPMLMSLAVFILTILGLQAGKSPTYLPNAAILSLNTTGLKESYSRKNSNAILPIHDVYSLYMTSICRGYYDHNSSPSLVNVTCSHQSSYSNFLPGNLIKDDLTTHHSNVTLASLSFPNTIQDNFNEQFNEKFRAAFAMYIVALFWVGIAITWGILAFFKGALGGCGMVFSGFASTFFLIASVIVTVVQTKAVSLVNDQGNAIGISAYSGIQIIGLTWAAWAINLVSSFVWCFAGAASCFYRDMDGC